jgi:hypothetical protein
VADIGHERHAVLRPQGQGEKISRLREVFFAHVRVARRRHSLRRAVTPLTRQDAPSEPGLWQAGPRRLNDLAGRVAARIDLLADRMVEAFVAEIPVYAHLPREPLEGEIREDPLRTVDGKAAGTPSSPIENVPNTEGVDPHGPDATETAAGQEQLATFLLHGVFVDTCGDRPCYLDGWTGPAAH